MADHKLTLTTLAERGLEYIRNNASAGRETEFMTDEYLEVRVNLLLEEAANAMPLSQKQQTAIDAIRSDDSLADAVAAAIAAKP